MLYLSGNKNGDLLGVVDTDDNIEEFYNRDFLETCGFEIVGINKELPLGYKFETKYFHFTLVKIDNLIGWQLKHKEGVSVFKNKSRYLGYPVISLENCFAKYNFSTLDVKGMDTSNIVNMGETFTDCIKLTSLDLSNFNTSNVTNMNCMFGGSYHLTFLDLRNFDTSNVISMAYMFAVCESLTTLDLSNFDTSKVTNMEGMFHACHSLTILDLSNFDTSRVTEVWGMFSYCHSLTTLDLSNFDTSNANYTESMFQDCESLRVVKIGSDEKLFNLLKEDDKYTILVPKSLGVKYKQVVTNNVFALATNLSILGVTDGVYAYE